MSEATLEPRVDRLEEALMEMAYQSRKTELELERLSRETKAFQKEMRDFKDEMKVFKDEMGGFKDEMKDFKDEMRDFKDEMKVFKDEMKVFKDEMRRSSSEMNKKWGELANKMGTMAEDIIAPGAPSAIQRAFGLEVEDLITRRKKKRQGKVREYDVLALTSEYVFVIDVKANYKSEYVQFFTQALNEFFWFFPEFEDHKLIGVLGAFHLDQSIIDLASKNNYLALHMAGEALNFVNQDSVDLKIIK